MTHRDAFIEAISRGPKTLGEIVKYSRRGHPPQIDPGMSPSNAYRIRKELLEEELIEVDGAGFISLTPKGREATYLNRREKT